MGKCSCHPVAGKALNYISPVRLWHYGRTVYATLGLKLMIMVISVFFGLKGMMDSFSIETLLPFYKELNYDGVAYQRTLALAFTPYAMKGFIGSVSDYFPIFGYHKKYYLFLTNILGVACVITLVLLPAEVAASSIVYVGLLYCGIHLQIATADLLCEGVYCKVIRNNPAVGAKLVGFVSFCNSAGHMIGKGLVGAISDAFGSTPLLYACVPLALQSLVPITCNFLGEVKDDGSEGKSLSSKKGDRGIFYMAILTSLCACVALILNLQRWKGFAVIFTVGAALVLGGACWYWLSRRLALCSMFFFADKVFHLTIAGAVNFFYIAQPSCVPDGPHFDYTYFCTYTSLMGALGCWFAIFAFQRWFKGWSAKSVFWATNCVRMLAALFDYVIVKRLNVAIGIPDKVMFMLGDAIVYHLLLTLALMTSSLTIARSCPPNLESTVYAIVSGITSLGSTCSKMLGAVAIEIAGIQMQENQPGGCDFSALPNLILVSQCFLPVACIPLAYFMLPSEPLNSAAPPHTRRGKNTSPAPQHPIPSSSPDDASSGEEPSDEASDTLAIQGAVGAQGDVAAKAANRPRIVEV